MSHMKPDDQSGVFRNKKQISLDLKNMYVSKQYLNADEIKIKNPNWDQWAQGFIFSCHSPYVIDHLGFDIALYSTLKLKGSNPQGAGGNQLLNTQNQMSEYERLSSRLSLLNIRWDLSDFLKHTAILKGGLISANTAFTNDCDRRLSPVTYQGVSLNAYLNDATQYHVYYLTKIGFPAQTTYSDFVNGSNTKINGLFVAELAHQVKRRLLRKKQSADITMKASFGHSLEYLYGFFGQLTYQCPWGADDKKEQYWLLDVQYRASFQGGSRWDSGRRPSTNFCWMCMPSVEGSALTRSTGHWFDDQAQNINVNFKITDSHWRSALSYTYTRASASGTGMNSNKYHYALIGNDCGAGTFWTSRYISSFNYDQENTFQMSIGRQFKGVLAGLDIEATGTYGANIQEKVGLKNEVEFDVLARYTFKTSALKGLSLGVDYAYYKSNPRENNTYGAVSYQVRDIRCFAQYHIDIL